MSFLGLRFNDTERSEILRGLSYHDMESEAPFILRKIFDRAEPTFFGGAFISLVMSTNLTNWCVEALFKMANAKSAKQKST